MHLPSQLTLSKYSREPLGSGLMVGESGVQLAGHTWENSVEHHDMINFFLHLSMFLHKLESFDKAKGFIHTSAHRQVVDWHLPDEKSRWLDAWGIIREPEHSRWINYEKPSECNTSFFNKNPIVPNQKNARYNSMNFKDNFKNRDFCTPANLEICLLKSDTRG